MCSLIMSAEILKYPVSQTMKATSVSQSQHTYIRGFLAQSTARVALHVWHYKKLSVTVYYMQVVLKWFCVRTQMLHCAST